MAIIRLLNGKCVNAALSEIARAHNLSLSAKGLMAYILTCPEDQGIKAQDIEDVHGIGPEYRQKLYRELESAGYLSARREQNKKGHWSFLVHAHGEPLATEKRTCLLGASNGAPLNRPSDTGKPGHRGGFIYLMSNGKHVKIGMTRKSLKARMAGLQTSSPIGLTLIWSSYYADVLEEETALHAQYAAKRVRGEWFDLSSDEIARIVQKGGASHAVSQDI